MLLRALAVACLAALFGAAPAHADAIIGFKAGTSARTITALVGPFSTRVGPETVQVFGHVEPRKLLRNARVRYVEDVGLVTAQLADNQWGLLNTGQFTGTPGADIDVTRAWATAGYGASVLVGSVDS